MYTNLNRRYNVFPDEDTSYCMPANIAQFFFDIG